MKRMPKTGYTILEVMIFLAITGVLFASAAVAVGGSQRQAQYSQAVRDFETQIKDVANDTLNGYYPLYDRGRCQRSGSSVQIIPSNNPESGNPGTYEDCINVGKNLMFNLGDSDSFGVGTIVGVGPDITEQPDLTLAGLQPTLAYSTGSNSLDLTTSKPIRYGAEVTKIGLVDDNTKNYSSLVFLTSYNTGSQIQENGVLAVNVYGIEGSLDSISDKRDYQRSIEDLPTVTADVNPINGFYICLRTSDDRIARIVLGVDGVPTATRSEFDLEGGVACPA